ncbi:hypothetical protein HN681_00210 [archaeon]|jgi:hypothetical protein|nr:hypothetical protein [archaeon]MBT3730510.1 hypothetical protein [archaeon]MBT4669424.1 hypothetical protein [archaeon]MBT5029823.1 hypothetical protein [archaeon]MBT5288036.1 hypothetical protein [archaeon]
MNSWNIFQLLMGDNQLDERGLNVSSMDDGYSSLLCLELLFSEPLSKLDLKQIDRDGWGAEPLTDKESLLRYDGGLKNFVTKYLELVERSPTKKPFVDAHYKRTRALRAPIRTHNRALRQLYGDEWFENVQRNFRR